MWFFWLISCVKDKIFKWKILFASKKISAFACLIDRLKKLGGGMKRKRFRDKISFSFGSLVVLFYLRLTWARICSRKIFWILNYLFISFFIDDFGNIWERKRRNLSTWFVSTNKLHHYYFLIKFSLRKRRPYFTTRRKARTCFCKNEIESCN